ncbi:MAG: peptidyl-prolyl cis-trans isomerase [Gemmatimonadetes bacterium]|nr:peptidyl-prolyl cis-trans isomerase [Gemmatimonadota bacterium]
MLLVMAATTAGAQQSTKPIRIRIETQLGNIDAELDSVRAPVTVTNFLRYVDAHLYDDGTFFRTVTMANQPADAVKIEVIQGGAPVTNRAKGFPAIPLERTSVTHLHHGDGTLSVARGGPDSGTDQFFVVINDQPELDFGGRRNSDGQGFAAFGHVTAGMDIVRKIQSQPAKGQSLETPVSILRIIRR